MDIYNFFATDLRIPKEDAEIYKNELVSQGFDDLQSVREDLTFEDLRLISVKPGHLKRILRELPTSSHHLAESTKDDKVHNKKMTPFNPGELRIDSPATAADKSHHFIDSFKCGNSLGIQLPHMEKVQITQPYNLQSFGSLNKTSQDNELRFVQDGLTISPFGFDFKSPTRGGVLNRPTVTPATSMSQRSDPRVSSKSSWGTAAACTRESIIRIRKVGSGGSGTVFAAIYEPTFELLAVKSIEVSETTGRKEILAELKALYSISKYSLALPSCAPLLGGSASPAVDSDEDTPLVNDLRRCASGYISADSEDDSSAGRVRGAARCRSRKEKKKLCASQAHGAASAAETRSPYIVKFYDAYTDPQTNSALLVLEYLRGGSLQDQLDRGARFNDQELLVVAYSVLKALSVLHAKHIVHRDIKPANILCDAEGRVKLSDFGIMRDLSESKSFAETFTGTLPFMSPERIRADKYTSKSDIWSLGITLLTLHKGYLPFPSERGYWVLREAIQNFALPDRNESFYQKKNAEELRDFIEQCLCVDPFERPSAATLLDHPFIRNAVDAGFISETDCPQPRLSGLALTGPSPAEVDDIVDHIIQWQLSRLDLSANRGISGLSDTACQIEKMPHTKLTRLAEQLVVPVSVLTFKHEYKRGVFNEAIQLARQLRGLDGPRPVMRTPSAPVMAALMTVNRTLAEKALVHDQPPQHTNSSGYWTASQQESAGMEEEQEEYYTPLDSSKAEEEENQWCANAVERDPSVSFVAPISDHCDIDSGLELQPQNWADLWEEEEEEEEAEENQYISGVSRLVDEYDIPRVASPSTYSDHSSARSSPDPHSHMPLPLHRRRLDPRVGDDSPSPASPAKNDNWWPDAIEVVEEEEEDGGSDCESVVVSHCDSLPAAWAQPTATATPWESHFSENAVMSQCVSDEDCSANSHSAAVRSLQKSGSRTQFRSTTSLALHCSPPVMISQWRSCSCCGDEGHLSSHAQHLLTRTVHCPQTASHGTATCLHRVTSFYGLSEQGGLEATHAAADTSVVSCSSRSTSSLGDSSAQDLNSAITRPRHREASTEAADCSSAPEVRSDQVTHTPLFGGAGGPVPSSYAPCNDLLDVSPLTTSQSSGADSNPRPQQAVIAPVPAVHRSFAHLDAENLRALACQGRKCGVQLAVTPLNQVLVVQGAGTDLLASTPDDDTEEVLLVQVADQETARDQGTERLETEVGAKEGGEEDWSDSRDGSVDVDQSGGESSSSNKNNNNQAESVAKGGKHREKGSVDWSSAIFI